MLDDVFAKGLTREEFATVVQLLRRVETGILEQVGRSETGRYG